MNSDTIKSRSLQTDLMRNVADMLQAVACMDDEATAEISEIVSQIEKLANNMEDRIGEPMSHCSLPAQPHLILVK